MQAVTFSHFGGPEVLQLETISRPAPRANEVLVKVMAVSVNHVDTFIRSGAFHTPLATPHIIGRDMVGTVVSAPADSPWQTGDLVWSNSLGYQGRLGASAEYTVVPVDRLYTVPRGVDPLQLVAAVHSAATAAIVLHDVMHITADQTLLIEGGAGNVGRKFSQLAAQLGVDVTTTSAPRDFDRCRRAQSHHQLDYHTDFARVTTHFDHIVDTSGQVALQANLEHLAPHGQVTLLTAPNDNRFTFDVRQFYMQDQRLAGFVISHATGAQLARAAEQLNTAFAQHQLLEDRVATFTFAEAGQLHAHLAAHDDHGQRFVMLPSQN